MQTFFLQMSESKYDYWINKSWIQNYCKILQKKFNDSILCNNKTKTAQVGRNQVPYRRFGDYSIVPLREFWSRYPVSAHYSEYQQNSCDMNHAKSTEFYEFFQFVIFYFWLFLALFTQTYHFLQLNIWFAFLNVSINHRLQAKVKIPELDEMTAILKFKSKSEMQSFTAI